MAFSTHSYRKLPLNESSNDLDSEYHETLNVDKTSWLRSNAYYIALHVTLLCLYTVVTLTIITQFGTKVSVGERDRKLLTYSESLP